MSLVSDKETINKVFSPKTQCGKIFLFLDFEKYFLWINYFKKHFILLKILVKRYSSHTIWLTHEKVYNLMIFSLFTMCATTSTVKLRTFLLYNRNRNIISKRNPILSSFSPLPPVRLPLAQPCCCPRKPLINIFLFQFLCSGYHMNGII